MKEVVLVGSGGLSTYISRPSSGPFNTLESITVKGKKDKPNITLLMNSGTSVFNKYRSSVEGRTESQKTSVCSEGYELKRINLSDRGEINHLFSGTEYEVENEKGLHISKRTNYRHQ